MLPRMPEHFAGRAQRVRLFAISPGFPLADDYRRTAPGVFSEQHGRILRSDVGDEVAEAVDFPAPTPRSLFSFAAFRLGRRRQHKIRFTASPELFRVPRLWQEIRRHRRKHCRGAWKVLLTGCRK